jgi:predicted metal-dependent hydrolase
VALGDDDPCWHPRLPELAAVANAVSLLMPHIEPAVARAMAEGAARLDRGGGDPDLVVRVLAAEGQEAVHHREHRAWNEVLAARYGLTRIERWMAATGRRLDRSRLGRRLAFSAGFEAVAFVTARWVDRRLLSHFRGIDAPAARLFLWHLAEEVEHRGIAEELDRAVAGGRRRRAPQAAGMICALMILGWFTMLTAVRMLWHDRRLLHPVTLARLTGWALSYSFELLPALAATVATGGVGDGRRDGLVDPPWLTSWLRGEDLADLGVPAIVGPLAPQTAGSDPAEAAGRGRPAAAASDAPMAMATVATATGPIDQRS